MLESIPVTIIIGILLGALAGIGVGGGSLLMLWLTFVLEMEHSAARTVNLFFFLPSALIASAFRWKQGGLNIKKILPAILSGIVAAGFFSLLSHRISMDRIQRLFGILLLFTGLRELFYRPKKAM